MSPKSTESPAPPNEPLFQPLRVGDMELKHRVALAPLTRFRANIQHVHSDLAVEYYSQRGSVPGTLLITEATFIAPQAGGYDYVPGIWSEEQIQGWKKVTTAVHANGSYIYLQLWALGRASKPEVLARDGLADSYVSASPVLLQGKPRAPREMTKDEIKEYVGLYRQAAVNAVHKAGFDGVEIHGANGYLLDQFLQDVTNKRNDEYGGSIENRCRFPLEVAKAVTEAIGEKKTGIRFSPWSAFQDMGMTDPIPTFSHIISSLRLLYPDFAYIHLIEAPFPNGDISLRDESANDFARALWDAKGREGAVFLSCDAYTRESAVRTAKEKGDVIVFGRPFIANPDLPRRLKEGLQLNKWDRTTFYTPEDPVGYIDYPFAEAPSTHPENVNLPTAKI